MHDTGNNAEKFPMKPALLEPLETSAHTGLTHPSQTTGPAKVLQDPNRRKQLWLYQEQGINFQTEEVHYS